MAQELQRDNGGTCSGMLVGIGLAGLTGMPAACGSGSSSTTASGTASGSGGNGTAPGATSEIPATGSKIMLG